MPLAAPDIAYLCGEISKRSGNVVSASQSYLLESRLSPVAKSAGLEDVHSLVKELQKNPRTPLHDQVTEAMTINETSFFRDMQPFDALRDLVLPEFSKTRQATKSLSIWSAASSSGQEAYSIAMLIRTHFPKLADWRVRILGTDLSEEMVKRTRDGSYSQFEVNRGMPASMLVKNFDRTGLNWQAKPELRKMVESKRMNLASDWPPITKYDVIFLRNVLIYFDKATKEKILLRVHKSMRPDSYLFLGGGETLIQMNLPFERVTLGKTVAFRPVA